MIKYFIINDASQLNQHQIESMNEDRKIIISILINNINISRIKARYIYISDPILLFEILKNKSLYKNVLFFVHPKLLKENLLKIGHNKKIFHKFLMTFNCYKLNESENISIQTQISQYFNEEGNLFYFIGCEANNDVLNANKNNLHFNINSYTLKNTRKKTTCGNYEGELLSICFVVHNRTLVKINNDYRSIFPNCLESVKRSINNIAASKMQVEICILDLDSKDKNINSWIHYCLKGYNYKIKRIKHILKNFDDGQHFDRGEMRNIVGEMSTGNYILWLDSDMIINEEILLKGIKLNKSNQAFFPVCFYCLTPDNKKGFWANGGYGNCMITRHMFNNCKWPQHPQHKSYFGEDVQFFNIIKHKYNVDESNIDNYIHQFHPGKMVNRVKLREIRENSNFPTYLDLNKNNLKGIQ